jgi:hypothetical protein
MRFDRVRVAVVAGLILLGTEFAQAQPPVGVLGDYNFNGLVDHADYSVLGDLFGSNLALPNDATPGSVTLSDFDVYVANYGGTASPGNSLPLAVVPTRLPNGSLEWIFTFANVNGSLAGHLNIDSDQTILSVTGGPAFLDDGDASVGVPGLNASNAVEQGISFGVVHAFAALGTTLTSPPTLPNSDATLEFLRVVTKGSPSTPTPTTLTYAGEFGYLGIDYGVEGSASFVPEPATSIILWPALVFLAAGRSEQRRRCFRIA